MRNIIKKVPIPLGGLALALASLGMLLSNWFEIAKPICGILSFLLLVALVLKAIMYPKDFQKDIKSPMIAAVVPISFIAVGVLDTYIVHIFPIIAKYIWLISLGVMIYLLLWFLLKFVISNFSLKGVFTSWYIPFVGLCVMAWTSPIFGMKELGYWLFLIGFITNVLVSIPTFYRYFKLERPEGAKPLFAIFPAPFSATIAAYLSVVDGKPNLVFVIVLLLISQTLFVLTLLKLPSFLKKPFYPSWVAMTFPFVITASMLMKSTFLLRANGYEVPAFIDIIYNFEIIFASIMVFYIFGYYCRFLLKRESTFAIQ